MLEKLSDQIRTCHERATAAARKAEDTSDPGLKADYLAARDRWLSLADSYALTNRITDYTAAMSERKTTRHCPPRAEAEHDSAYLLQEISTALIQEGDINALYERILDGAISLMNCDMGSMQVFNPEQNELRLLAWRGFHPASAAFWDRIDLGSVHTSCGVASSSGRRIIVPDTELCDFIRGSADLEHYRLSNIRAVQSTPLVSRSGQLLGMLSTEWREPHQPSEIKLRLFDVLARQAADLIAMRENEQRTRLLAFIVDSSDDAIVSMNLDGVITSWNKGAERLYLYTAEEAIGQLNAMLIPEDRQDHDRAIVERVRRGQRIEHFETVRKRKHGSTIDVALTMSPIRNEEGKIVGVSKIARDITERKRSEERIAALAREAEHRTKNILATVQATINLSHADTLDGLKQAIDGRIRALANVHALFVQSRWTGAELSGIVTQELAPFLQEDEARARIDGSSVLLEPNTAQMIAVVVHELATNASKYGALSVPEGRVAVEWSRGFDGRLVINWTERRGPPVVMPTRQGFGMSVIEQMIRSQLKGRLCFDWQPEGLACEISLPM